MTPSHRAVEVLFRQQVKALESNRSIYGNFGKLALFSG
jgi:hypothetical protein